MSMAGQCTSVHTDSVRMLRKKGWPDDAHPSTTRLYKTINKHVARCKGATRYSARCIMDEIAE